ncbi:unnamed protein product [Phytophthora fragariaefolia]|uniref:Unnamed protein product n=1 Tax=Phytophthora fragariaefolia TaxID=1490495 RepID=A0A9W6XD57_9STRA|nr:unnamed protein product [Phytophthora fragariaefolia]
MLTRFFELCASEAPENQIVKTMVYPDIPKEFRWDAQTLGSPQTIPSRAWEDVSGVARDMERFYLRVLLCHRKGRQSFEHLRTVDGVMYETYRQAALRLGFLEDDAEWISCMREAAEFRMPYQLRQRFTTILVYSQDAEARQLWERFYDDLSQDFARRYRALLGQEKDDMIEFKTLKSLNALLQISGYAVADFNLPQLHDFPALVLNSLMRNNLIRRELEGYDQNTLQAIADQEDQLNEGQRAIFDEIIQAANDPDQGKRILGEGRHEVNRSIGRDFVKIPQDMLINNNDDDREESEDEEIRPGAVPRGLKKIIDVMYADINNPDIATDDYFANRTILTTTNTVVHRINEAVFKRLFGDSHVYLSIDKVDDDNEENFFEQEVLHSININGIPPHKLTLKKGAPIMMMRNLNPDLGLCNGTRLRIIELKPHVIHATTMTGERQGQHVLIPMIVFISDGTTREFPFRLRRKQFPVVPAFAMTINKAQGQTVQNLGLYLATPCFSHGQLYVALSRVTSRSKFKALIEHPELEEDEGVHTDNIVYRHIFDTN